MLRALLVATSLLGIAAEDDTCSTVLHYFNIRGRAEAIRMALHDLNIPFVDHSFSGDEWGKEKADGLKANWTAAGKLSFGQVPMLEIDGIEIVQSHSILRYLGRRSGTANRWYKGTPAALAKIDVAADGVEDVRKKLGAITYANAWDRTKRAMLAKYMKDPKECALWLGYFDRLISGSESGFVAGSADASHADYLLLDLLDHHVALSKLYKVPAAVFDKVLDALPALTAWAERMRSRANLKAYLEGPSRR